MKLALASSMKKADETAINKRLIPSLTLMRTAAGFISETAVSFIHENKNIAVFSGTGNNGGDGICAASILTNLGYNVRLFIVGNPEKLTRDSKEMLREFLSLGKSPEYFDKISEGAKDFICSCGVIIDALFGIGLSRELKGDALNAVKLINSSPAPVVSADIPSGVNADTGEVMGDAVKADCTVTFSMGKPGLYALPGALYAGEVIVKDIGIPTDILDSIDDKVNAVTLDDISLPKREKDTHKGTYGKCLIVGGSVGFSGAPVFASDSCVRSGAGLVFLEVPEKIYSITASKCSEAMPYPLPCNDEGKLTMKALSHIFKKLSSCDACLIGPGLGRSNEVSGIVYNIMRESNIPLIIDADGINAVSENIDILKSISCPVILTPHDGEFKRLGGDLSKGRIEAARSFSKEYGCIIVLKGYRTITAFPDGEIFINTSGNPGMAKGGSGDVLSGIITSFVGQGMPLKKAVPMAVYIHGLAGDICAEKYTEYAMTPSDIIKELPSAFKEVL